MDTDTKSTVTVSDTLGRKKISPKMLAVFGLIAIVVIAIIAVFTNVLLDKRAKSKLKATEKKDFQIMIDNVKTYRNKGQDTAALSELTSFDKKYAQQENSEQKYKIANEISAIYQTAKDYKNAVVWQEKALAFNSKPGFNDYNELGETYVRAKDNANAVKYLKLALQEIEKDKTNQPYQQQKQFITAEIAFLEKRQK